MYYRLVLVFLLLSWVNSCHQAQKKDKHPDAIRLSQFIGPYLTQHKMSGMPAESLTRLDNEPWHFQFSPLPEPLKIGVLLPNNPEHDLAWQPVVSSIYAEAKKWNINVVLKYSDGYSAISQHQHQFQQLLDESVDAIILASMHYRAMDELVLAATKNQCFKQDNQESIVPVIAVVNDIYAQAVCGKVMVAFSDMGKKVGEAIIQDAIKSKKDKVRVAFFPGPINAGWAPESLYGFVEALRSFSGEFELIEPRWGTPEAEKQRELIEDVMAKNIHVDYIVGNAVAAEQAAHILATMGHEDITQVFATYYSPALTDEIERGLVKAAPSDQPQLLGRLALQMAIKFINKPKPDSLPFRIAPNIPMCSKRNLSTTC
ncbi:substrate-binding domain-containing protein [Pleionea sp. CnH1-48]|uniref:substrate-binding domain-containing protein n=1 Tax=Pleionea sp. CnH1-48 TaxID=2954494 RepID=UPI002096C1CC|nr:substrate-binding domain-containing protein [Pleionea sp. CnH1-48]MCO7226384.1 substrate-binding domain-containing protein [Pleionea sp. CnH1-48]